MNFRLPEIKTEAAKEGTSLAGTLKSGLLHLDRTVTRFVENPIFQQLQVVDVELTVQAAEDLNKILRLTDSLRRMAKQNPNVR
jgi:hypothetical protein